MRSSFAAGAPLGLWLEKIFGVPATGVASVVAAAVGLPWALAIGGTPILPGDELPFAHVRTGFPYGLSLALAGIGFGTIASFITL